MTTEAARRALPVPRVLPLDLRGTLFVAVLWGVLNALLRRAVSPWLSGDDAKTNLFTQAWRWGYQADNPPLFEWMTKLLHVVTPSDLWSFLVLKYACVVAAALFTHLSVRRMVGGAGGERAGFVAAASLVLLYPVGWSLHQAFTHSALLLAASAAFVWALLRLTERRWTRDYLVLGAVLGVGLLSKYNFAILAAAGLAACALRPGTRRAVADPRLALSLALAAALVAPHAAWLVSGAEAYRSTLSVTLGLEGSHAGRALAGTGALLVAGLSFLLPWGLVAGWRWRGLRPVLREAERLLLTISGLGLALMLLGIVAVGASEVSERYVLPVMLPAYLALSAALLRAGAGRALLLASAAVAVLVIAVRTASALVPAPPFCDDCWDFVPYGALTETLAETVPPGSVLLAREENTAGNLVQAFPDAKVLSLNLIPFMNPTDGTRRPCYYVWSEDMTHGVPLHPVFRFAYDDPQTVLVNALWRHPLRTDGFRRTVWGVTPLDTPRLYERFCVPDAPG